MQVYISESARTLKVDKNRLSEASQKSLFALKEQFWPNYSPKLSKHTT